MKPRCDPNDRTTDPIAPQYPGNQNHAVMGPTITCPGCKRTGRMHENGWGRSPPHGWWVAKDGTFYCSSECIAHRAPAPLIGKTFVASSSDTSFLDVTRFSIGARRLTRRTR